MAIAKLFWSVEPAFKPKPSTELVKEILLLLTELSVSAFVHVSALLAPDVNTKFVGTRVEDMRDVHGMTMG
jgi:hypothetical protein